jgi:restriction endonuclease S subunit
MNSAKVRDIAKITTGFTFRKDMGINRNGILPVLQAKDISKEIIINATLLEKTIYNPTNSEAFLQPGDVALTSRGKFKAAVYESDIEALASSSIYIIRLNNSQVLPKYLAIYLNSKIAQGDLTKLTTGGSIQSLLKLHVEYLEIPIPPQSIQQQIVSLYENITQQQKFLQRKMELIIGVSEAALQSIISNNRI